MMNHREYYKPAVWKESQGGTEQLYEGSGYNTIGEHFIKESCWADQQKYKQMEPPLRSAASLKREPAANLQRSRRQIERLNLILEQKEQTLRAVQLRDDGLVEFSMQINKLEVELKHKDGLVRVLSDFFKIVSKQIDAILKSPVLIQVKLEPQAVVSKELDHTPDTSPSESDLDAVWTPPQLNIREVLQRLGTVEAKIRKLAIGHVKSSLSLAELSPSRTKMFVNQDNERIRKLQEQKEQLQAILKKSEDMRGQLATRIDSEFELIKKQLQKKPHRATYGEEEMMVLLDRISRKEKQLHEEKIKVGKLNEEYSGQLRKIYAGMKQAERKHQHELEMRDRQIADLKRSLQK